jgi:hypothetical protein
MKPFKFFIGYYPKDDELTEDSPSWIFFNIDMLPDETPRLITIAICDNILDFLSRFPQRTIIRVHRITINNIIYDYRTNITNQILSSGRPMIIEYFNEF